jgi:hypothetical protein
MDHRGQSPPHLDRKTALLWLVALVASVAAVVVFALDALAKDAPSDPGDRGPAFTVTRVPPFLPRFCMWRAHHLDRPAQPAPTAATAVGAVRAAVHAQSIPTVSSPAYWIPFGEMSAANRDNWVIFAGRADLLESSKSQRIFLHAEPGAGLSTAVVVRRVSGSTGWRLVGWETGDCSN